MYKLICTGMILLVLGKIYSQQYPPVKNRKLKADSTRNVIQSWEAWQEELPVAALQENTKTEDAISYLPSLLSANRDVLISMASFHFAIARFKQRGYDAEWSPTLINGIPMNNPEDGNTPWAYWSGLNDATRNTQLVQGTRAGDMDFGNIGNTISIDMRAFKQREQTQFGYSVANRNYRHRLIFSHGRGFSGKGWAYAISGSLRYTTEGYTPGTFYQSGSYCMAADKKLDENRVLSLVFFGSYVYNGKQSPVLKEITELLGPNRYNAYWGYQAGKKRNASTGKTHVPVLMLTYDHRFNNHSSLLVSIAGIAGSKKATAPDWYNTADPRPDYYRYLPGYQKDTALRNNITNDYLASVQLQQINWDKLYAINRNSYEITEDANGIQGNSMVGLRSHYILEERVSDIRRMVISAIYTERIAEGVSLIAGGTIQWQQLHYYKKINDLLGGGYYVDWNQFAEGDISVLQNDLNRPNRILYTGDKYGYSYRMLYGQAKGWMQVSLARKKTDVFAAAKFTYNYYQRDGLVRTGLFPNHSFGRSVLYEFPDYAVKAGITYKLSGKKYLYLHAMVLSRAPYSDNVFISPRIRHTEQENMVPEKISSVETGYVWNTPSMQLRLTAYATKFSDGMNVLNFYHDVYRSFVNYALTGIDKLHFGMELGAEIELGPWYRLQLAASVGRYYFSNRQHVTVSADNDAYVIERDMVYSKNFRVGGSPQEAYALGFSYQSEKGMYANISCSYFRQQWLEFNPLRRTYNAVAQILHGSDAWNESIGQVLLPDQYTVDFSAGNSFRFKYGEQKIKTALIFISINNLLNKKDIVSGGYEQLRFDANNPGKFPPKFFYAMGLNFSIHTTIRL